MKLRNRKELASTSPKKRKRIIDFTNRPKYSAAKREPHEHTITITRSRRGGQYQRGRCTECPYTWTTGAVTAAERRYLERQRQLLDRYTVIEDPRVPVGTAIVMDQRAVFSAGIEPEPPVSIAVQTARDLTAKLEREVAERTAAHLASLNVMRKDALYSLAVELHLAPSRRMTRDALIALIHDNRVT